MRVGSPETSTALPRVDDTLMAYRRLGRTEFDQTHLDGNNIDRPRASKHDHDRRQLGVPQTPGV